MKNIDVSVIVPVYNSENYLKKCLDSLSNQTLKNIEIICIDDESEDNSLEILEEYAKNDSRIKIISKKHGGAGAARNVGLDNIKGKYVSFVDSDDWIEDDALELLYQTAKNKSTDIIMFKMLNFDNETNEFYEDNYYNIKPLKKFFNNQIFNHKDIKNKIFKTANSTANKFYKKEFLDGIEAKFPEGYIFEDNPFFFDVILNAERIILLDEYLYYRRRRGGSVMSSKGEKYIGIIHITNIVLNVFKNNKAYKDYKKGLINFKISSIKNRYNQIDEIYKNEFFLKIKEDFLNFKKIHDKDIETLLKGTNADFYHNTFISQSFEEFDLLNNISILKNKNQSLEKENSKLKNEVNLILSSTSWNITKPLRKINKIIKNKINK